MIKKKFHSRKPYLATVIQSILFISICLMSLNAREITISWNASSDKDVAGYKVYYGLSSRKYKYCIDTKKSTQYTIPSIPDSGKIYFAVTAYDSEGNESQYSEEVSIWNNITAGALFSLKPCYPNPFNPQTQIPYTLHGTVYIELIVYDILGRQVKVLYRGVRDAGNYKALWDGRNSHGKQVSNGIYFCRLIVGDFCQTKKLIVVR